MKKFLLALLMAGSMLLPVVAQEQPASAPANNAQSVQAPAPGKIRCYNCGAVVSGFSTPKKQVFCSSCNVEVLESNYPKPGEEMAPTPWYMLVWMLIQMNLPVCISAIVVIIALVVYSNMKKSAKKVVAQTDDEKSDTEK